MKTSYKMPVPDSNAPSNLGQAFYIFLLGLFDGALFLLHNGVFGILQNTVKAADNGPRQYDFPVFMGFVGVGESTGDNLDEIGFFVDASSTKEGS